MSSVFPFYLVDFYSFDLELTIRLITIYADNLNELPIAAVQFQKLHNDSM